MRPAEVHAGHVARLARIDPLATPGVVLADDGGASLLHAVGDGGQVLGRADRVEVAEDSEAALWGPLRVERLRLQLAGTVTGVEVTEVLGRWLALVAERSTPGDRETAAVVTVPSRDTVAAAAVAGAGLAPLLGTAVRRRGVGGPVASDRASDVAPAPRAADVDDLDALAALAVELHATDARFGMVTERAAAPTVLRDSLAQDLTSRPDLTWVVDGDQRPLGYLRVQLPPDSGWIADAVTADRVAYLADAYVRPDRRGTGAGTALVAAAHARLDAEVDVTVLHHALPNPWSTPFWARHGYRPLLTTWVRRPAVAVR